MKMYKMICVFILLGLLLSGCSRDSSPKKESDKTEEKTAQEKKNNNEEETDVKVISSESQTVIYKEHLSSALDSINLGLMKMSELEDHAIQDAAVIGSDYWYENMDSAERLLSGGIQQIYDLDVPEGYEYMYEQLLKVAEADEFILENYPKAIYDLDESLRDICRRYFTDAAYYMTKANEEFDRLNEMNKE